MFHQAGFVIGRRAREKTASTKKIRIITSLDEASLDMLEKEKGGNYFSFEDSDFRRRHLAE